MAPELALDREGGQGSGTLERVFLSVHEIEKAITRLVGQVAGVQMAAPTKFRGQFGALIIAGEENSGLALAEDEFARLHRRRLGSVVAQNRGFAIGNRHAEAAGPSAALRVHDGQSDFSHAINFGDLQTEPGLDFVQAFLGKAAADGDSHQVSLLTVARRLCQQRRQHRSDRVEEGARGSADLFPKSRRAEALA